MCLKLSKLECLKVFKLEPWGGGTPHEKSYFEACAPQNEISSVGYTECSCDIVEKKFIFYNLYFILSHWGKTYQN